MSVKFHQAIDDLLRYEGGFSDSFHDRGGRTNYGITERNYQKDFPGFNIEELTVLQAKEWYHKCYWIPLKLDQINSPGVCTEIFEQAVNMPWGQAVKHAQEAVNMLGANIPVDGFMGPQTILALNSCPYPEPLVKILNGLQVCWYLEIVRAKPEQKANIRGWLRRVVI